MARKVRTRPSSDCPPEYLLLRNWGEGPFASFCSVAQSGALVRVVNALAWYWEEAEVCPLLPSTHLSGLHIHHLAPQN